MEDGLQDGRDVTLVIAGLDPAIHHPEKFFEMDTRVKPAYDNGGYAPAAITTSASSASRLDWVR